MFYDKDLNANIEDAIIFILEEKGVFTDVAMTISREVVHSDGSEMSILFESGV